MKQQVQSILERIARQNGVSVQEVRAEMQSAINEAYASPTARDAWLRYGFNRRPSVDEFLICMAQQVKKELPAQSREFECGRILN